MTENRIGHLGLIFGFLLVLLFGRLAQLQIFEHDRWSEEARRSRLQKRTLPFHRGRILDRQGEVLAEDRRAFDLMFEYRAFRRGHPAGQLVEAWALLGQDRGGLPEVMDGAESLGEELLYLLPASLASLSWSASEDLAFYLRRLAGLDENDAWRAWRETGTRSVAEAFPASLERMRDAVGAARQTLADLEHSLGPSWEGNLLSRLEFQRVRLELRIRQEAVREAAGRASGRTAFSVRDAVAWTGREDPSADWRQERAALLVELAAAWDLPSAPSALEELGTLLAGGSASTTSDRLVELGAFLRRLEAAAPEHLTGVRRHLVRKVHRNRTLRLSRDLAYDAVDRLARLPARRHPGLYVMENPRRTYPAGIDPQLVGLVRSANESDLAEWLDLREEFTGLARLLRRTPEQESRWLDLRGRLWRQVLRPGETRGRSGIERAWEPLLRGDRGFLQVLDGEQQDGLLRELDLVPPRHGRDVVLTLDAGLQKAARAAVPRAYALALKRIQEQGNSAPWLKEPRAAVVLIDLESGGIPVLATVPGYTASEYRSDYSRLVADTDGSPLRHRGLGGGFSGLAAPWPGSTLKPLWAAAALADDPAWAGRYFNCNGSWAPPGGGRALRCDVGSGHGPLNMHDALVRSCNVWFYQLANAMGYHALWTHARALGYGEPSGIELVRVEDGPGGRVAGGPDAWLERGANFLTPPDKAGGALSPLHLVIGQGHVLASPLQVARSYGWLATGTLPLPRLVLEGGGVAPAVPASTPPTLAPEARARIHLALREAVSTHSGTAFDSEFNLARWQVAGKTGTAQVSATRADGGGGRTHAWFAGFFPWDQPRYAFAVFCENAGVHGGGLATLVLHEFLEIAADDLAAVDSAPELQR